MSKLKIALLAVLVVLTTLNVLIMLGDKITWPDWLSSWFIGIDKNGSVKVFGQPLHYVLGIEAIALCGLLMVAVMKM